ncbi:hypothetical protein F5B19DRAFT_152688 [Rostrohypoxylon terebratum]|nr:hypothetical protein F5B19DRAFT_152688 [Rostrohypoxylon terebratum]
MTTVIDFPTRFPGYRGALHILHIAFGLAGFFLLSLRIFSRSDKDQISRYLPDGLRTINGCTYGAKEMISRLEFSAVLHGLGARVVASIVILLAID